MTFFGYTPDEIKELIGIISLVGGSVVTGLSACWKWLIEPSLKVFNKIDYIHSELKPNGGGSIKDAINRLEVATTKSQYRHRMLVEESEICSFETDKDGQFHWVSKDWSLLTGLSKEEAFGNGWINSICHQDRQRIFLEWEDALDQKRDFITEFCVNENCPVKVRAHAQLLRDAKGETLGMIGKLILLEKKE